jgi:hypothetical protein
MASQEIQQLSQELGQLTRALQGLVSASSKTAAAQQANFELQLDVNEQLDDYQKGLTKGQPLNKRQQKILEEAVKLKREEIDAGRKYAKAQKEAEQALRKTKGSEEEKARKLRAANTALKQWQDAQTKTTAVSSELTSSMGGLVKGTNLANAGLVWFGAALKTQGTQLLAQNAANSGVVEGTNSLAEALFSQQNTALKYRLAGDEFAKIATANRQVINAMGGSKQAFTEMSPVIDRFRILTGDSAEGARLAAEAATEFAKKGVKPTQHALQIYTNDIVQLGRRTGMGAREAAAYFNEIASDTESIDILRSARAEEREAILKNQRAFIDNALAQGMSTEQAKEAAKVLNKMAAAKPLDRLKQAAKVRALGGAMGIAGSEEAAQAIIAGKRATKEQKEALAQFSTNAANAMDKAAGQGLGTEIFASELIEKLNLDQYYGKGSAFSTTLGDTMTPAIGDLQKAFIDTSENGTAQLVGKLTGLWEQLQIIISGKHWGGVAAAALTAIAGMLFAGKLGGMAKNAASGALEAGKKILGKGATAAGTAAPAAATTAGKVAQTAGTAAPAAATTAGKAAGVAGTAATAATAAPAATNAATKAGGIMSKLGTVAKGAGIAGAVYDVGSGISDLAQGKKQETMEGMEMLSPMKWGMFIGDKINKGFEGITGDSIGGKLYDMMNPDVTKQAPPAPPTTKQKPDDGTEAAKKTAESNNAIKTATIQTADGVTTQLKKMDASNDYLKQLTTMATRQIELAEKQLIAATMTEKERTQATNKTALRSDNKFASQYNYV